MRHVLAVLALALVAVPAAEAAKVRFRVSVEGRVSLSWHHEVRYVSNGCEITQMGGAAQELEFRSRRPKVVSLSVQRGRIRSLDLALGSLSGRLTGGGSTETADSCGPSIVGDCNFGTQVFSGATLRLVRPARGQFRLSAFAADELQWCGPPAVLAPPESVPFFQALGRVNEGRLLRRRTAVVTAVDEGVTRLAAEGETGELTRRVTWKATFRRLSRR